MARTGGRTSSAERSWPSARCSPTTTHMDWRWSRPTTNRPCWISPPRIPWLPPVRQASRSAEWLTPPRSARAASDKPSRLHRHPSRRAILDHAHAVLRRQRDCAELDLVGLGIGGAQRGSLEYPTQHQPHFHLREARAETAAGAAAKRDPGVGVGWVGTEEALGAKRASVGVQLLAPVHHPDRGVEPDTPWGGLALVP